MVRNDFQLFLGEDRIPVIRWVNRFGSPTGRDLRFTVPLEAKSKLEANPTATYTLKRDDESWDFEMKSIELHTTGTNGCRAVGRVKQPMGLGRASSIVEGVPKPKGSSASDDRPKSKPALKLKLKKSKSESNDAQATADASATEEPPQKTDDTSQEE